MSNKRIEQHEIEKFWEIFSELSQGQKYLTGNQAAQTFKNSRLREDQLERVWDLADVDKDGNLDFEEFCVAMKVVFELLNGEIFEVPKVLPDWLVPESKAHLVQANRALTGQQPQFEQINDDDDGHGTLKDGFEWYMSPSERSKYEEIYSSHRTAHGEISFLSLQNLYDSLDVPDTDVRSAWNLINPSAAPSIGKDQTLAYLHVLSGRHEGFRIPRSVPASLRATFERGTIEYSVDRVQSPAEKWGAKSNEDTNTGRKAKFGEAYASRLGHSSFKKGTDFTGIQKDSEFEQSQLKRQLRDLEEKIERAEKESAKRSNGGRRDTKPALVKRELEMLLDYKKKELKNVQNQEGKYSFHSSFTGLSEDIQSIKEQIDGLESHLRERESVLDDLKSQITQEKVR